MTYPTISHFIENIIGIYIPLPIQTFGFFIVLAFIAGHYFIHKEFQRLESIQVFQPIKLKLSKSHTLLSGKDIKINTYYSGGEDIWVTPVIDKNNNLVVFSYNPTQHLTKKDILLYNVKILVNDEFYTNYDNKLGGWHLTFVKNFDEIKKLTIIRNNKKIVNYDFSKIDKEKFKQLNRYEIK